MLAITLVLIAALAVSRDASAADSGTRLALLIANANYPDANLPSQSAAKDTSLLASELSRYGFSVDLKKDLTRQDMQASIDAFYAKIVPGATVLLYFNGIGIQAVHQTFLLPVNAQVWSEGDVKREGVNVDNVLAELARRGAKVKIAILDAARRNPFERRFRAYSAGLAAIDTPEGSLVVYSAAPNKIIPDNNGDVTLFMNELVKELRTPDINAEEAMTQTRIGVSRASNGEEVPWVASSLAEPFYFGRQTTSKVPVKPKPVAVSSPPNRPADVPATPPSGPTSTPPTGASENATKPPEASPPIRQTSIPPQQPREPVSDKRVFRDCSDCPEMILLPSATYRMGTGRTPFDKPVHEVTIARPFAIGVTAVTVADWNQCASDGACKFHPDVQAGGDRPVTNLGWSDAHEYTAWLSKKTGRTYRLPTESEWEFAAHGGTTTPFYWGTVAGSGNANCADCGPGTGTQPMPVKSFRPNAFGLYDMAGNAAEWIEDCWHPSYRGAPTDGSAWTSPTCEQRVLRGGSFDSTAVYISPSARFRYDADVRYYANGFRLARDGR